MEVQLRRALMASPCRSWLYHSSVGQGAAPLAWSRMRSLKALRANKRSRMHSHSAGIACLTKACGHEET